MFKTLIAGIVLGIAAGAAALYYVPAVDQYREQSIIKVAINGGNTESFHVNVPMDRIMIGAQSERAPLPVGLEWPQHEQLAGFRAELFKLRNGKDAVVGVASRMATREEEAGDVVEWVLHLPARGTVYVTMQPEPVEGGFRRGEFAAGTREFSNLYGTMSERWIADTSGSENAPAGRIELITAFVSTILEPLEEEGEDPDAEKREAAL